MNSLSKEKKQTKCNVSLKVTLKEQLPEDSQLYVTGNIPQLGSWDPAGVTLQNVYNNTYEYNFTISVGSLIECKITRGTWKTQGIYDDQEIPPSNLIIKASEDKIVPVKIIDWLDKQVLTSDPVIGTIDTHDDFLCKGLKYKRSIQVWTPPGYENCDEPFSVVYMHDGQNLFEPAETFAGVDWRADETAYKLMKKGKIRNCIIVGIPNSPDRMQELDLATRKGKAYAKFIINEVKPFVDSHYNTRKDPANTAIMGSSMGGLMSFQMATKYPNIFQLAGCLSPSFQITKEKIFDFVQKPGYLPHYVKYYLDSGEYEPPITRTFVRMMKAMKKLGFKDGYNLLGYYDKRATHCEAAWAKRLHIPFKFLLG